MLSTSHNLSFKFMHPLTLFFIFTTFVESASLEAKVFDQYGIYIFIVFALIALLLGILFYKVSKSTKRLKQLNKLLAEKDLELEKHYQSSNKNERQQLTKEHELEKKILELTYIIKEFEEKEHEGLKSQVVTKIEEYQTRRSKLLKRAGMDF